MLLQYQTLPLISPNNERILPGAAWAFARRPQLPPIRQSLLCVKPRLASPPEPERIVTMAWTFLSIAGLLEIAFAFGLKWSIGFTRPIPGLFTVITGLSSIFLLSISLRTLPVGTGYAVWTGIGAVGTAILGMAFLGESAAPLRVLCIGLILVGVIGLKLAPGN